MDAGRGQTYCTRLRSTPTLRSRFITVSPAESRPASVTMVTGIPRIPRVQEVLPALPPSCCETLSTTVVASQRTSSTGRARISKTTLPQTTTRPSRWLLPDWLPHPDSFGKTIEKPPFDGPFADDAPAGLIEASGGERPRQIVLLRLPVVCQGFP